MSLAALIKLEQMDFEAGLKEIKNPRVQQELLRDTEALTKLVRAIKYDNLDISEQRWSIRALASLASNPKSVPILLRTKAVNVLFQCLQFSSFETYDLATGTIVCMLDKGSNPQLVTEAVSQPGFYQDLVALLSSSEERRVDAALEWLVEIASVPQTIKPLIAAGAAAPLVALLHRRTSLAPLVCILDCLCGLCTVVNGAETTLSCDILPPLIEHIRRPASSYVAYVAIKTLNFIFDNENNSIIAAAGLPALKAGAIDALLPQAVNPPHAGDEDGLLAHEWALKTLVIFSLRFWQLRDAVWAKQPDIIHKLLQDPLRNQHTRTPSIALLFQLSTSWQHKERFAASGAIQALFSLLTSSSITAAERKLLPAVLTGMVLNGGLYRRLIKGMLADLRARDGQAAAARVAALLKWRQLVVEHGWREEWRREGEQQQQQRRRQQQEEEEEQQQQQQQQQQQCSQARRQEGGHTSDTALQTSSGNSSSSSTKQPTSSSTPSSSNNTSGNTSSSVGGSACASCGGQGSARGRLHRCSGCRQVRYCSTDCQRAHWKQHRKACLQAQAAAKASG